MNPQAQPDRSTEIEELIDRGNLQAALQQFQAGNWFDSKNAKHQFLYGWALFETGNVKEATDRIRKAIEIEPESARYNGVFGTVLLRQGKFEEAAKYLHRSLEIDPTRVASYFDLIYSRKVKEEDRSFVDALTNLAESQELPPEDRKTAEYALGKAHDDLEEYGEAMAHFDRANEIAKELALKKGLFDGRQITAPFEAAQQMFNVETLRQYTGQGNTSDKPIFVVGMMRSGTTLVEQILSSHPDVAAGGELFFWMQNRNRALDPSGRLNPQAFKMIAMQYLDVLEGIGTGKKHVTDKMPQNFLALGLIHLIFPNAKIIHCRRNPVDTCLSIYFTPNNTSPSFFHDKEQLTRLYEAYLKLMEHWRQLLPRDRFLEVDYESIVENHEQTARQVLSFSGLEWDDSVLRHESNERQVLTASLWQVRQPIYRSALNRRQHYEPWLGSLAKLSAERPRKE